jgi:heme A synthase
MRAVSVPVHLVNTLFLLGALTATAWITTTGKRLRWHSAARNRVLFAAVGLAVLGATGAIAALADTLFPAESLVHGLRADFDATAHFLTRLRTIHPVVAAVVAVYLLQLAGSHLEESRRAAVAVMVLVVCQLLAGVLNVVLLTPIWLQVVHLLIADLLWVSVLLLGFELSARGPS